MVEAVPRASVPGPTLVRLLARLRDTDVPHSPPPLAERLTHWIDWPGAVVLAGALDTEPAGIDGANFDPVAGDECSRVRTALETRIATLRDWTPPPPKPRAAPMSDAAAFRRRYVELQGDILAATGRLRGRLRDMLAASTGMARLAEVDAVMERVLGPREHTLLAQVPALLQSRFEQLSEAAEAGATAWLDAFRRDMQALLRAELEFRFQPVEGLLAALRTTPQGRHDP